MRILCIASAGGHIEQMVECLDAFRGHEVVFAYYNWPSMRDFSDPRVSRQVGVFYAGTDTVRVLVGTFINLFQWAWLLATFRPKILFSTGAEIAIVPFWLGRIFLRARCLFIETASRQERPSRTGPLVYPVCDVFFVQSEALLKHYGPKARYTGRLL